MLKIAIVGAEKDKWTKEQKKKAKSYIHGILCDDFLIDKGIRRQELVVVSGHCPKGGVDIWAEEIADELGIKKEVYLAEVNQWEDEIITGRPLTLEEQKLGYKEKLIYQRRLGYKSRNILIAEACDVLYDIEPAHSCKYCSGKGYLITLGVRDELRGINQQKFRRKCPKCESDGAYSGGTWTFKYARKLGKEVHKVIINEEKETC